MNAFAVLRNVVAQLEQLGVLARHLFLRFDQLLLHASARGALGVALASQLGRFGIARAQLLLQLAHSRQLCCRALLRLHAVRVAAAGTRQHAIALWRCARLLGSNTDVGQRFRQRYALAQRRARHVGQRRQRIERATRPFTLIVGLEQQRELLHRVLLVIRRHHWRPLVTRFGGSNKRATAVFFGRNFLRFHIGASAFSLFFLFALAFFNSLHFGFKSSGFIIQNIAKHRRREHWNSTIITAVLLNQFL